MPQFFEGFRKAVCHWKPLKASIGFLKQGNSAGDRNQKWEYYGKCLAKLIEAIGVKS